MKPSLPRSIKNWPWSYFRRPSLPTLRSSLITSLANLSRLGGPKRKSSQATGSLLRANHRDFTAFGLKSQEPKNQRTETYDLGFLVLGSWFLVLGSWFLVLRFFHRLRKK